MKMPASTRAPRSGSTAVIGEVPPRRKNLTDRRDGAHNRPFGALRGADLWITAAFLQRGPFSPLRQPATHDPELPVDD